MFRLVYKKLYRPCGSPPLGDKLFQKIEWLIWPPPLNLIAGAKAITDATSPVIK